MARRVDTPGEITDPQSKTKDVGPEVAPFLVEIPLWRWGRIKIESRSQKASLALIALLLLVFLMIVLSLIEALPGQHPGVASLLQWGGQGLALVLGVLLGVDWKRGDSD
jgi:hypothetical protein